VGKPLQRNVRRPPSSATGLLFSKLPGIKSGLKANQQFKEFCRVGILIIAASSPSGCICTSYHEPKTEFETIRPRVELKPDLDSDDIQIVVGDMCLQHYVFEYILNPEVEGIVS
jgi:hypothetical protein